MGPMSLCVASYLPFTVSCFMNGHSCVAQELRRAGVRFQKDDNAIVRCADPDRLTAVAERLDEHILRQRADYWASRLTPRFSPRERALDAPAMEDGGAVDAEGKSTALRVRIEPIVSM